MRAVLVNQWRTIPIPPTNIVDNSGIRRRYIKIVCVPEACVRYNETCMQHNETYIRHNETCMLHPNTCMCHQNWHTTCSARHVYVDQLQDTIPITFTHSLLSSLGFVAYHSDTFTWRQCNALSLSFSKHPCPHYYNMPMFNINNDTRLDQHFIPPPINM